MTGTSGCAISASEFRTLSSLRIDSTGPTIEEDIIHLNSFFFMFRHSESPSNIATSGLAKVGARAALSFAFAFLKRAWRSGEDSDLCTEVLQEALGILQEMPVALLFDTEVVSGVWIDVVDRTMKFLTDVCRG